MGQKKKKTHRTKNVHARSCGTFTERSIREEQRNLVRRARANTCTRTNGRKWPDNIMRMQMVRVLMLGTKSGKHRNA